MNLMVENTLIAKVFTIRDIDFLRCGQKKLNKSHFYLHDKYEIAFISHTTLHKSLINIK